MLSSNIDAIGPKRSVNQIGRTSVMPVVEGRRDNGFQVILLCIASTLERATYRHFD